MDKEKRYQTGTRVIRCVHCNLDVSVTLENGALKLAYDFEKWRKGCCCDHLLGPSGCSSLEDILQVLPCPPNNEH